MSLLRYSSTFGGSPSNGDAASIVGGDNIITVGGKGPDVYEIEDIILQYAIPGATDYDAAALRSFTGRLTVVEGIVDRSFTVANPSAQLYSPYPSDIGNVVFDMLIHDFRRPWKFNFTSGSWLGALRTKVGLGLSVIAVNPVAYVAGVPQQIFISMLHVAARKTSDTGAITLGPYHTAD